MLIYPLDYSEVHGILSNMNSVEDLNTHRDLLQALYPEYSSADIRDLWRSVERGVFVTLSQRVRKANERNSHEVLALLQ